MKVEFGWPCGLPLCRPLTGHAGLFEVRSKLSGGRSAEVIFTVSAGVMWLLHGFIKKSRATPRGSLSWRNGGGGIMSETGERNSRVGTTLESLLREDDSYEEAKNQAVKSVLAYKLERAMKAQKLSKSGMAARMDTSRSQLDRLLDPENDGVTLHTLKRAAAAVGMRLEIELRQV